MFDGKLEEGGIVRLGTFVFMLLFVVTVLLLFVISVLLFVLSVL